MRLNILNRDLFKAQKNPCVRKIRVRNSGAGNGCANFMDTWKKCVLSAGKPMSIKFCVLGGVLGGGKCRFYFYGREDFSEKHLVLIEVCSVELLVNLVACLRISTGFKGDSFREAHL